MSESMNALRVDTMLLILNLAYLTPLSNVHRLH